MISIEGLPSTIRVGCYDIRIIAISPVEHPDNANDYGAFHPAEQEIRLHPKFPTGALAVDTLLHELLHAAWFASANPRQCGEERAVSGLSPVLTQIIRDHPEILAWMQKALGK